MGTPLDYETIKQALKCNAAAFRCRTQLQPAGGAGDKVFPPTFSDAVYAVEKRRVAGKADPVTCVLLDSVQSQANRMEAALQDAYDAKEISIPLIDVDFSDAIRNSETDDAKADQRPLDDPGRITSLLVPHRIADAIFRDSELGGKDFRASEAGIGINHANLQNATPMYMYCPTALVFGVWDSTGPKGGLGAKFERAMVSEVVGIGASLSDEHKARGVRRDPLEIRKSVPITIHKNKSWELANGKKGSKAPSEINHGSVPFHTSNAGTTIDYAEQITTLSLIALRRLKFPVNGIHNSEQDAAAHVVLVALGLCAATLAFEAGMALRSRCLLWPEAPLEWELLAKPGKAPERFSLDRANAVKLLNTSIEAAESNGLKWHQEPLTLKPSEKLVGLIRKSQKLAVDEDEKGGD